MFPVSDVLMFLLPVDLSWSWLPPPKKLVFVLTLLPIVEAYPFSVPREVESSLLALALNICVNFVIMQMRSRTVNSLTIAQRWAIECSLGLLVAQGGLTMSCLKIRKDIDTLQIIQFFFVAWWTPSTWSKNINDDQISVTRVFAFKLPSQLIANKCTLMKNKLASNAKADFGSGKWVKTNFVPLFCKTQVAIQRDWTKNPWSILTILQQLQEPADQHQ